MGYCHGTGKMIWKEGETYEGDYNFGKRTGNGKYTWTNGDTYEGGWLNGKFEGEGRYLAHSGEAYNGGWREGLKQGFGTYVSSNKDIYVGNFEMGKYHDRGLLTKADGTVYDGYFKAGQFIREANPTGIRKYTNGAYEGEILNGQPEGRGKMIFTDGRIYEGDWKNRTINGWGKMLMPKSGMIFSGFWENGHIVEGQKIYPKTGDYYYGKFVNDKPEDPKGRFVWKSGSTLEAPFIGGKQALGEGTLRKEDGCIISGPFENYKSAGKMSHYGTCGNQSEYWNPKSIMDENL